MNKQSVLIFITAEYPYGEGETFIEAELEIISSYFDHVVIIPTEVFSGSQKGLRKIPLNCSVSLMESQRKSKPLFHLLRWSFIRMGLSEYRYIKKKLSINAGLVHFKIAAKSFLTSLIIKDVVLNVIRINQCRNVFIYSYWMGDGLLAAILAKRNLTVLGAVKVFSRAHGWDVYFERHQPAYLPWRKFMFEKCDAVFCISKDGQRYLKEKVPNGAVDKIKLSYLGVPEPLEGCKMPDFTVLGLRIVSCSNVIKVKRVVLILEAILCSEIQNICWTHIGDGPLLKDLKLKAADIMEKRPDVHIKFVGHLLPAKRDELLGSGNFHLFVNVSESEGLPVSVMEAMSFGIPVLATAVGGTAEIVENGINGLIISEDVTPQDLVSHLEYFNGMPLDIKQQWSNNAKQTWLNSFNSEKNHVEFAKKVLTL